MLVALPPAGKVTGVAWAGTVTVLVGVGVAVASVPVGVGRVPVGVGVNVGVIIIFGVIVGVSVGTLVMPVTGMLLPAELRGIFNTVPTAIPSGFAACRTTTSALNFCAMELHVSPL
jgi:hypothetical protein